MGGGGGKGGGVSTGYDYYGTIAAAICGGPVDTLYAVLADGKAIWEDTEGLARGAEDYVSLEGAIDAKYFTASGYLRFYWGTATQTADAALTGHPAYPGVAYLAGKNFLFGNSKSTAPNLEVVCARAPICSTDLVAALDNVLDDGQANPVAVLAELLVSVMGIDAARLHAASWAAAGAYAADHPELTFCSPLLTSAQRAREVIASLLAMFSGGLYWTTDGLLGVRLLQPGIDPGGLTELGTDLLTAPPKLTAASVGDLPTGYIVRYCDRDRKYKEADEKLDNLLALRVRGEDQRSNITLSHVTRRTQALAIGAELLRRFLHPGASLSLSVRREHAAEFLPGTKLWVDVNPEPGGDPVWQLATIEERRDPGNGPVGLKLSCDPLATTAPWTPDVIGVTYISVEIASIEHALIVPLPGEPLSCSILAARPQDDCIGFEVGFGTTEFAFLGRQAGFAVRLTLAAGVDADDTAMTLNLTDGADGRDAYLAGRTAGNETTAQTDYLLAVIATVTDGKVAIDGNDAPILEFCSVVSRVAVDSDTHTYTVLRGRLGLAARAWTTSAQVWIIPGVSLLSWAHETMLTLLGSGDPGHFRIVSYSPYALDDADPPPEFDVVFPPSYYLDPVIVWSNPEDATSELPSNGQITLDATIYDSDGDLVRVQLYSTAVATGVVTVHYDVPISPTSEISLYTLSITYNASRLVDFGEAGESAQTFTLTIRAADSSGRSFDSSRTLILPAA